MQYLSTTSAVAFSHATAKYSLEQLDTFQTSFHFLFVFISLTFVPDQCLVHKLSEEQTC